MPSHNTTSVNQTNTKYRNNTMNEKIDNINEKETTKVKTQQLLTKYMKVNESTEGNDDPKKKTGTV